MDEDLAKRLEDAWKERMAKRKEEEEKKAAAEAERDRQNYIERRRG